MGFFGYFQQLNWSYLSGGRRGGADTEVMVVMSDY